MRQAWTLASARERAMRSDVAQLVCRCVRGRTRLRVANSPVVCLLSARDLLGTQAKYGVEHNRAGEMQRGTDAFELHALSDRDALVRCVLGCEQLSMQFVIL